MKAERRHELQHNELADWLSGTAERLRPYSRAILGVTIAAVVLLLAYYLITSRAEKKQSAAWDKYLHALSATTPDASTTELEETVERYSKTPAAVWAEATLGDMELGDGIGQLFVDKVDAEKKIKRAIGHYEAVLEKADDPLLKARVLFGLAHAQESLGELEKARQSYEALVDLKGPYQQLAEDRVAALGRDSTHDFYAWFASEEPVRTPLPGMPGERLPFDASSLMPDDLRLSDPNNLFNVPSLDGPALPSLSTEFGSKKETKDEANKDEAAKDETEKGNEADTAPASKDEPPKESPPSDSASEPEGETAVDTSAEPQK